MTAIDLHALVRRRDVAGLRAALADPSRSGEVNACNKIGLTPLMLAVQGAEPDLAIIELLLEHGADVNQESGHREYAVDEIVMSLALGGGDPRVVGRLLQAGADLHYQRPEGYGALLDAIHSRDISRDIRLLDLLKLLISQRVELNGISSHAESGLRVLSNHGRFDAVRLLLEAGADETQLGWTPMLKATALGSLEDMKALVAAGASLEDRDWWERTPWLIALLTGEIAKARYLYEAGADTAACGRCGKPPLFYANESGNGQMLQWLLSLGADVEQTDQFGETPLINAVEQDHLESVTILLSAGAQLEREYCGWTALYNIKSRAVGITLLRAGADPARLSSEGHRLLTGLPADATELTVTLEEFQRDKHRRFGTTNPEKQSPPFWVDMVRSGLTAFHAAEHFGYNPPWPREPVWCARRFGQSITFLPDGRIVQIAGEHEDGYDPDFCIYNDVFVHHPDGSIEIFGYPEAEFPPTDFHTATLLEDGSIWIIGSLGYEGKCRVGETPVYRFDCSSLRIEPVTVTGTGPGWIHRHVAKLLPGPRIEVSGGLRAELVDGKSDLVPNHATHVLDPVTRRWLT